MSMCNHYESKRCDCLGGVCGLFQTSEDYYYKLAQQNSVTAVKENHERVEKLRDELAELINAKCMGRFLTD